MASSHFGVPVTLSHLLSAIAESPELAELLKRANAGDRAISVADLPLSARPAVAALAIQRLDRPALVITARDDRADLLCEAINEFLPREHQAERWPAPEALPYEQLPVDFDAAARRVALLNRLGEGRSKSVLVTPVRALMHLVMSPDDLAQSARTLRVGDRLVAASFLRWATDLGYQPTPLVQEPGHIARRGGIVDLYPPASERPIRIDLFGDEIESIRTFNPSTQRSDLRLPEAAVFPPTDLPLWRLKDAARSVRELDWSGLRPEVRDEWERMVGRMEIGDTPPSLDLFAPYLTTDLSTLLDHAPSDMVVIFDEPSAVVRSAL